MADPCRVLKDLKFAVGVDVVQNKFIYSPYTITDIKEHFEETKDNKDQVDKDIRDIKENIEQFLANAQSAPPEVEQPPGVHYGQGEDDRSS